MKKRIAILVSLVAVLSVAVIGCSKPSTEQSSDTNVSTETGSNEENYPISKEKMDENGYIVKIESEGAGNIARAEEGRDIEFNEKGLTQTFDRLIDGTKLVIAAKADDGWKFVKWTLNGEDYSTEEQFSYTVTKDSEFVAVFEFEEE